LSSDASNTQVLARKAGADSVVFTRESQLKEGHKAAKIIVVFNQKGGCAKTMSTMQLAGAFGLQGLKVFVADMDPQNTAALWFHQATEEQPFPAEVMSMAPLKEAFLDKLGPLSAKFDIIIIDCPPALGSRVPWAGLLVADLAIIPVIPVMDNVWASKQAEELVLEARQSRKDKGIEAPLEATYLLSMVRRGNVFEHCLETLRSGALIPILKSTVAMRNAFPESQLFGCVAKSFGKSPAANDIDAVAAEVAKLLDIKLSKPPKGK
jgi:chromosome partitioning protein